MDKFVWLRPLESKFEHLSEDQEKVMFQRELGFFLGTIEDRYKNNPATCLSRLEWYYRTAKEAWANAPICDPWSQLYFRGLTELLANFIQTFRAVKGLPPSNQINDDLRSIQQWVRV